MRGREGERVSKEREGKEGEENYFKSRQEKRVKKQEEL